jgi:DNA-binding NarL/FixJ family response regulator
MKKIRVLIVDDLISIRERFNRILSTQPLFEIVGTASTGYEAIMLAAETTPDIILMDIEMENKLAGIKASQQICKDNPDIKIIILTVYDEDEVVFSAFQTGIVDYLLKSASSEEVIEAIIAADNNVSPIRPIIAGKIRREFLRMKKIEHSMVFVLNLLSELTQSEFILLDLLSQGKKRNEIAKIRCVELSTIKSQINGILKKFNMKSTKEVIKLLNELQILETLKLHANKKEHTLY